jgi:hypothetical protein
MHGDVHCGSQKGKLLRCSGPSWICCDEKWAPPLAGKPLCELCCGCRLPGSLQAEEQDRGGTLAEVEFTRRTAKGLRKGAVDNRKKTLPYPESTNKLLRQGINTDAGNEHVGNACCNVCINKCRSYLCETGIKVCGAHVPSPAKALQGAAERCSETL